MSSDPKQHQHEACCWRNCPNKAANPSIFKKALIPFKQVRVHTDRKACLKLLKVGPTAWYERADGKYYVACRKKDHTKQAFFEAVRNLRRTTEDKNTPKTKVRNVNSIISDSRLCCLRVAKVRVRCSCGTKAAVFRSSNDPSARANCCCCAWCRCFAWCPFSCAYLA